MSPTRTGVSRKAAPAAPKMNKAELEVQLVKLERLVSRLRKQNKKLKAMVKPVAAIRTRKPRVSKAAKSGNAVEDDDASK